ncbi:uncharacterized protein LOC119988408 isoform X2 [Tripterygium wilfordii]|nr:uncharacterized protein LOC119988408 isoform X2 [Tripterygium wilfordii]XP_038689360.1 uncharacterized protein LOC119988408 isoform X2 [Tripterygium wilfordii]XP_038689361.1 uncharacterized protein LOC119988408 isoform X2 [Tripterygium wilfordii]XP_038689362.1 uncharacterized protein LOC119988408 isoform X2 [Tripterygium wilfordii]XP_038689363.1 uncharacterized protein LOC119988408 isoform X2 [Tripterygium wilfordii]XP_038689364.1 uncharacterized protein LOC119988408 isoform X2 [Tripterygiu
MIKHPSHRKHPLILRPSPINGSSPSYCGMCGLDLLSFVYNCYDCNSDIDIGCAKLARCFIQPESHKHHFTKWSMSDPFTCFFCGTYSDRSGLLLGNWLPSICTNCQVVVHTKCISLPFTVHLPQHDHPLIHTYCIPESQSIALICGICDREVNREFGCYSCQNCPCIVHANCALNNVEEVGQKFWAEGIETIEDELLEQEIEHFSHPRHKLFLVQNHDDAHEIETKCDGCMSLISCPFYKCLECDFSLHISCSKLPKQINHPLHKKHPLTLVPNDDNFVFHCWACWNWCHGLSYRCLTCNYFRIDVRCALVNPLEFYHDSHEHPLSIYTESNNCAQCISCGKHRWTCLFLQCKEECPFALDYRCATLPRTFKYEYDEHPLVLSYQQNDDSNGYLYCDICDQNRDPNHWFYGCPNYTECPNYVHPKCAHGNYLYVKLGTSIKAPNLHEHELFFISREQDFLPCYLCSKKDQELSVECHMEDCNFSVHCDCAFLKP